MLSFSFKQPGETIPGLYLDFTNRLLADEIISSATVTCQISGVVAPGSVQWGAKIVSWTATGGTNGDVAVFTVKASGNLGSIREAEVAMGIVEVS